MRITVLLLSFGWLCAEIFAMPFLAAAVCVAAISSCAALGLRHRTSKFFNVIPGILSITIAAFLTYCLTGTFSSGGGFMAQLAFILILAPVVPLVYALVAPKSSQTR